MQDFDGLSKLLKVLCEPMRLKIINMLSCGEICACKLLDGLSISQSTLSYHMKVLLNSGLISSRKKATWIYYSLNRDKIGQLHQLIDEVSQKQDECICYTQKNKCTS